jgi:hypothetical protein
VKVLEAAGLISRSRVAQARPCHLEPERLDEATSWISEQRRMWAERYDRLDQHLGRLQATATATPTTTTTGRKRRG